MNSAIDGQLEGENPGWAERILAAVLAAGILIGANAIGVLSWPRIGWLLRSLTITATIFVWFPEFMGGLASSWAASRRDPPSSAVRIMGWSFLLVIAVVMAVAWLSGLR